MKSYFEEMCDLSHQVLAEITGEAKRADKPYYMFGASTYDAVDGAPPRVRYRLDTDFDLNDAADTFADHAFAWKQRVLCRVWGQNEDQTMYEVGVLAQAHRLAHKAYFGATSGNWINQENNDVGALSFMVEFPIIMTCVLDGPGTGPYATITTTTTDISDDDEPFTTVTTPPVSP
jgi:hypothetical protein